MRDSTRTRGRRPVAQRRAYRAFSEAIRDLVGETVDRLENPTPFQYAKGDQKHFLGRLERLEAEPREMVLRHGVRGIAGGRPPARRG